MFASLLRSILRAAHCRGTHHRFALDALPLVQTDAGTRLGAILLAHHERYLTGAIDPDVRFCDFQNHVIHVTDGYWGGAPRVAHRWYDRMQRYLSENRFGDAAHAAGVLSHYFTDPLQPLHTQHCEREKVLHRPIEWSITNSYDTILQYWQQDDMRIVFRLSDGPGWLGEAILHGARFANRKYDRMLHQYDVVAALEDAESGLKGDLIDDLAELFGLAITGWARILERAACDAEAKRRSQLPPHGLAGPMLAAVLRSPLRIMQRWMGNHKDRVEIAQLIQEFAETGTLQRHLPAEVDIVHRVIGIHEEEKRWKLERQQRLASSDTVVRVENPSDVPAAIPLRVRNGGQTSDLDDHQRRRAA